MKLMKIARTGGLIALSTFVMVGCSVNETFKAQGAIEAQALAKVETPVKGRPVVQIHEGAWLLGEKVRASKPQPEIYDKQVVFRKKDGASLAEIATFIAENVKVRAVVDASATDRVATSEAAAPVPAVRVGGGGGPLPLPGGPMGAASMRVPVVQSLNAGSGQSQQPQAALAGQPLKYYAGTFKGFLEVVDARYNVWDHYRDGIVTFFRTETRTYQLPSINDSATMTGSISTGDMSGATPQGAGGAQSASPNSASTNSGSGNAAGGQTIGLTVQANPWNTLQATAQAIGGSGAQVVVDKDLGILTVSGTPPQCDRVEDWVKNLTSMYGKQVAIDVHVYQIQKTSEDNYGMDLTLAYTSPNGHTGVSLTGASPPTVLSTSTPMQFGASILGGTLKGSSAAVQALSSLGHVTQLISRSGVTQNGKVLALQAATQQGYVASTQSTQTASVGSSTTMQTATLVPGFTSSFLPKVIGDRVLIDFDMTLSDLLRLDTFSVGSGSSQSSVQLPKLQVTRFEQSVSLKPGDTLILTGMREHQTNTTNNGVGSPYMPLLGGGVDAQKAETVIAVVISARLM
jgi:type IVB pilus formation R64 PilN family outer membrane protein